MATRDASAYDMTATFCQSLLRGPRFHQSPYHVEGQELLCGSRQAHEAAPSRPPEVYTWRKMAS